MQSTHHLALVGLALAALAGTTGCFHVVAEEVRVRDPHQVSVMRADGTISLSAGAEPATGVQREGVYWHLFTPTPYRVLVERDAEGGVALRCDGCVDDAWMKTWSPTLVTGDGALESTIGARILSSPASAVTVGADQVDLRVRTCVSTSTGKGRCKVDVEAQLATPRQNVVEIRRRRSPVPAFGALLVGWGAVPMAAGALIGTGVIGRLSTRDRILAATPLLVVGAAVSSAGIWHLTTPVEERVIYRTAAGE